MKINNNKGEIVTLITIGTLVIIGITTLVSSVFLKNKQTTKTKAIEESGSGSSSVSCASKNDPWYCAGECADQGVRNTFNSVYPPDGSDEWRNEKAANCNIDPTQCSATDSCSTPALTAGGPNPTKAPNPGGFHLTSEIYAEKTSDGVKFNTHVLFNSDGCDGDIMLYRDGAHIAGPNGWRGPGPFDYDENWAGRFTVKKGQSISPGYRGTVDRCPKSPVTLQDTIQCTLFVDSGGNPGVTGAGCTAKGFSNPAPKPTPIPTTAPTKKDGSEGSICGKDTGVTCKGDLVCGELIPGGYGYRVCAKPTPTPAGAAPPGAAAPAAATGRCTDNFGAKIACPTSKQGVNIKEYVSCNASGREDAPCTIVCVNPTSNERVECLPSLGFPDNPSNPIFGHQVIFINSLNQSITIKRIAIRHTRLGLTTSWTSNNYNDEIKSNQFKIYSGSEPCYLGGGRHIAYIYTVGADTNPLGGYMDLGCKERTAIEIK